MSKNRNCSILLRSSLILALLCLVQSETKNQSASLKIIYDNGLKVENGKELTPTQVKNQPQIEWDGYDLNAFYTLIMYDPDAPSRADPKNSPFLHWLVINIPSGDVSKGNPLAEYIGSGPPLNSGLHRYIFELYKQPGKLPYSEAFASKRSINGRPKFDLSGFIKTNNLGQVLASNQYQAQWDEYVPMLYKQVGKE